MSIELLYKASYIKEHPLSYCIYVFVCTLLSLYFSFLFSAQYSSILFVCFVVFTQIPLFVQLLLNEEQIATTGVLRLKDHPVFRLYALCMIAFALAMIVFLYTMPAATDAAITKAQMDVLSRANNIPQAVDFLSTITANAFNPDAFATIFANNYGVMNLVFVAALIFGGGALFLLLWNMSVLVTFIWQKSLVAIDQSGATLLISLASLLPHALIEFAAYVLIALTGSILGIALVRHTLQSKEFKMVFREAVIYYVLSLILLLVAAAIESMLV